jgi:hypothetical protein
VAERALHLAGERLAGASNVTLECLAVPGDWPGGRFDLIVLGELGYYLDRDDLDRLAALTVGSLEPGGTLLAVHWRHLVADYPLTGGEVHAVLGASDELDPVVHHIEDDFVLDVWRRAGGGPRSVAARTRVPGA